MIPYYGDFAEDATVYIAFNTFSSDDPSASVTITALADGDIKVHKDGSATEIVTDGATVSINFDSITGNHLVTIDTSVHSDYATGSDYHVRMEGTTIDGATVNAWIGHFSIENRSTSVLSAGITAETNNDTLIEQLKLVQSLVESQRGSHTHQPMGSVFFVSPNDASADTYGNGNRGGVSDPFLTIQDCIDNAVTDSNHDVVIVNADASGGATTYNETITCDKRYMFLRGPGRDCILTRTGDGDTITISADGVEISGFQINTASGASSGNAVSIVSADFAKIHHCWFSDSANDAIEITVGSNYVIKDNTITGSAVGIQVNSGAGSALRGLITNNAIFSITGHGIQLAGSDASFAEVHNNRIWNISNDGVFINSSCTDTIVSNNAIGNCTNENIDDDGTDTVLLNNETYSTAAVVAELTTQGDTNETKLDTLTTNLATVDGIVDTILLDTAELQTDDVPGLIAALENIAAADVLTQVNAALDTAISELGVAAPTATPTLRTGLMLLYMSLRNKLDITATTKEVHNNSGTKICEKALSDAAGVYSEAEMS